MVPFQSRTQLNVNFQFAGTFTFSVLFFVSAVKQDEVGGIIKAKREREKEGGGEKRHLHKTNKQCWSENK